jgi:hypothetical protein
MFMLQLLISLMVFSNVFHQTYAVAGMDNWTQENQTTPSEGDSSDVDRILIENATIYNSTPSVDEKPREAGGPSSLPLYQPANIFSSGGQSLGASPLVAGPMTGSQGQQGWAGGQGQQGWAGGQGQQGWAGNQGQQGVGKQGLQGYGNVGAGKGSLAPMVGAKGKNVGADFIPPPIGAPYPVFNGIGNIYTGFGGGWWCPGCGGNLVIPPLPPIPPQIFPPTYIWHPFPPLPPFPNVIGPALPPITPEAPIMPPPMQQDSSMGQQLVQSPGFGGGFGMGKGQQMQGQQMQGQQNFPPMQQQYQQQPQQQQQQQQQQGQAMQPMQGQQMQGQNLPIFNQQGFGQQMQGSAMQGF